MNIFKPALVLSIFIMTAACQQNSGQNQHEDEPVEVSPNQALYDEVMDVHDEVMPKMNDLHKAKNSLKTRLEMPGLGENETQEVNARIARIDSAADNMMVWMRQFNPIPDSLGEEKARAYLENELVKVKKVRDDILDALKTAASED